MQNASDANTPRTEKATFGAGCFWKPEAQFRELDGVVDTAVGYEGGHVDNPTYEQVCRGDTGHVEVVEVEYDPERVAYEDLVAKYFEIHDPTQLNRQGPDQGSQYRSAVFYMDAEQKAVTERLIRVLKENGYDVVTEVSPAVMFWPAEGYHQDYYERTGGTPYCHGYVKRFPDSQGPPS